MKSITDGMPGLGELAAQFEEVHKNEDAAKKHPPLTLNIDEMVCGIYSSATICFLNIIGESESSIMHMTDRHQVCDFPKAKESLRELCEATGMEVTDETYIWEISKALAAPKNLDNLKGLALVNAKRRDAKLRPHYH